MANRSSHRCNPVTEQRFVNATAGDAMTTPAICCRESTSLEELADLLANREISGVPVVNEAGEVTGLVSEADLVKAAGAPLLRLALKPLSSGPWLRSKLRWHAASARDVMSTPPITVSPDTPLPAVAEMMVKNGINRVPVVRRGELVGIVSRGDILATVASIVTVGRVRDYEPPVVLGRGPTTRQ